MPIGIQIALCLLWLVQKSRGVRLLLTLSSTCVFVLEIGLKFSLFPEVVLLNDLKSAYHKRSDLSFHARTIAQIK
jgi:cytochrome bd-type quinol oxidase subunit 2